MTSTTSTNTLNLSNDTLTLVRLDVSSMSDLYDAPPSIRDKWSDRDALTDDERTFYAVRSPIGGGYATLLVPNSDPRHRGMWIAYASDYAVIAGQETVHHGWNVESRYLSPVEESSSQERPAPASAALGEAERRALPVGEAYPVGSQWRHVSYPDPVTITAHPDANTVRVDGPEEHMNRDWPRSALDVYGTFAGWADNAPEEPRQDGETFTREDVERARREGKEEAAAEFERWKEAANERAIEYANDNGLCGEFERCMSDIGLMGREEWKEAHEEDYEVVITIRHTVRASDSEEAEERAYDDITDELSYDFRTTHSVEVEAV